ncbi:uncharacterized protein LOC141711423 [Apium graveolens]|uniref:uncharacterized protein LOC141711423 n=1 Tax=Apium graveolens TaxID=4045 RepID=UPI003D7B38B4
MIRWIHVVLMVAVVTFLMLLLIMLLQKCCHVKKQHIATNIENGIVRLHQLHQETCTKRPNYYVFRRGVSSKPLFSWSDNPALVTDAVENGWSRFAFTNYACYTASPSVRSARTLLGVCAAGDQVNEMGVEISWEVCQGSADFMQKVRLNSGLEKSNSSVSANSVIKTGLPFPGPSLGNSAFPREAYFEITILACGENDDHGVGGVGSTEGAKSEGEKAKLIQDESESIIHVASIDNGYGNSKLDESVTGFKEDGKNGVVALSLGLSGGGFLPLKLPGSYSGSIGFNSNGSVYLDGTRLVSELEKEEWGRVDKVIGCGYNPSQKKVFLTVDSELVHEIHCKTEEFGTPLYPTMAANIDMTVLVNLGQSVFKYAPANLQRTPNPCFIGPITKSPALGYEDSKELFSMGRIDSQWLNRSATRGQYIYGNSTNRGPEFDEVSEGDLFEIVLESSGRSPHTPLYNL